MSWAEPKNGIQFRVCVSIVDDTYWDDGNRTTSRDHDFAELVEAHEFLTAARELGWYETISGVTKEKLRRHLDPDSFRLFHYTTKGWKIVNEDKILDLLALL